MSSEEINSTEIDLDTQKQLSLESTTNQTNQTNQTNEIIPNNETLQQTPCFPNNITKENIIDTAYLLSHIAFATILVICLKNINTSLLTVLLSIILGYISYHQQNSIPIYTLFFMGLVIYLFDLFVISNSNNSNNSTNSKKLFNFVKNTNNTSIFHTLASTLWKLPYYGIISYYIILYVMYCFKKN